MSVKDGKEKKLLYNVEKDGKLEIGDVIYIYEDGAREPVKARKNARK